MHGPEEESMTTSFVDSPLLYLHETPFVVEYFSENLQLIYWLEKLRPAIIKEWKISEEIQPCFWHHESRIDQLSNIKYPHLCWHKTKRMLPMRIIDCQV